MACLLVQTDLLLLKKSESNYRIDFRVLNFDSFDQIVGCLSLGPISVIAAPANNNMVLPVDKFIHSYYLHHLEKIGCPHSLWIGYHLTLELVLAVRLQDFFFGVDLFYKRIYNEWWKYKLKSCVVMIVVEFTQFFMHSYHLWFQPI